VSDQHLFDVAALTAWLSVHLDGFAGPLSVEMFKGGQSNPTYKLITPQRNYVMRAKPGPANPSRCTDSQAVSAATSKRCWSLTARVPTKCE
jgi:aminoglycoside phosphotransferase (APT) family kinase protein